MIKKAFLATCIVMLGAAEAYAAGSEINANVLQQSTMTSSKVIGAPEVELKAKDIPIIGEISVGIDGTTKVNQIVNEGKLGGTILQTSNIEDSVVIGSKMNTIDNKGTVSQDSLILQENTMKGEGNVIVGTSVNSIVNK